MKMNKFSQLISLLFVFVLVGISASHVIKDDENLNNNSKIRSPSDHSNKPSDISSSTHKLNILELLDLNSPNDKPSDLNNNLDDESNVEVVFEDTKIANTTSGFSESENKTQNNLEDEKIKTRKLLEGKLNPIVIIPGLEGSRLEITFDKKKTSHYYCKKKQRIPLTVWISLESFVIPFVNCWVELMTLSYNNETRRSSMDEGVNIYAPNFGDTEAIETLIGNRFIPQFYYFQNLVDVMADIGYERRHSIHGAPFDFRFAPNEQEKYFKDLIQLIESTYLKNGKRKVILICHSMGCLYTLHLLNVRVNDKWKNRYISTLFSFSAPWAGSIKAVKTMITGNNMGVFLYGDKRFKDMERTFPAIAFLLPPPTKFGSNEPIVVTPSKNYTFKDYEILFNDIKQPSIYEMWLDTNNLVGNLKFPNVDLYCVYGTGIETERQLIYDKDSKFPENPKKVIYDTNGDSTVNLESLEYCLNWKNQKKYKVESLKIDKGDHLDIVRQEGVIQYLKEKIIEIALSN